MSLDKHRQSKLRVDELVLLEREACYKVSIVIGLLKYPADRVSLPNMLLANPRLLTFVYSQLSLETARADAMEDSLKAMTAQLALEHTRRDNLQQALDSTRSKLDGLERESKTRTRDAESSEWHQLDGLNRQLDALQKKLKVAADGEAFWKDRARTAELAVENATRNNNKTTRHDEGVVKLQDAPCIACIAQREENETLGTQLRQSQANLESISSAKHTADSKNLQLSNALAALEKTLASRTAELQDELQDARQDLAIFTVQSEEQVNELERRLHEYEQATTANVADIAGTRRRLEEQLVVNDSLLTQLAEAERRMDDAESRLVEVFKDKSREVPSSVAASPNSSQILLDTPDASLERGDKEVLSNRLALCQEELRIAQSDKTALENDCEALSLQVTHLTSELQVRDERISGLSDDREVNDNASIATYQHLQAECKTLTEALKDREEDIFSTRAELESLKRDALSLRDQLQSQSAQSSSPRQHRRPSSIPFCPSPLRQASFPPPSYSSTVGAKLSSLSMRDNQEQAVVLVARLRQERDDAIDQLEYHVAESAVANKALQEDLAVLKNEKSELDQLLQNFKTVVKKKEDLLAAADADVQRLLVAEKDLSSTVLALQIKLQEGDTAHQGTLQQLQDLENEIGSLDSERDRQKLELARTCEDRRVAQGTVTLLRASHDALQAQILDSELHWHTAANNMKQKTDMYHAERTGLEIEISAKQQEFKAVEEKLADTAMQLEGAQNLALQLETQLKEQAVRSELCEAETQKVVIRLESELADIMAQRTRDTGEHVRAQQKLQDSLDQAAVSYRHAHDTIGRLQLQLADQAVLIEESAAETEASAASADGVTKLVIALAISARDATRLRATMRSLLAAAVIKTGRLSDEISRRIGMQQANESLSAEAAEQQLTLDSVTARLTQLVDHVHSSDEATAVLRAQYEEALQRNGQLEAKLSQMDHQDSAGLLIDLASRNREIEQLRHKYAIAQQDLEVSQVDLRKALAEIDALRNELHLQQEEGRDLVADFNRLSGEMEQLEQQDQTRRVQQLFHSSPICC
ncbi:nuclear mitotic apparatus protein 1 [Cystobasidiomycetes sp. EMM_F5]